MKQLTTLLIFFLLVSSTVFAQKDKDYSAVDMHSKINPTGKATDLVTLTNYLTEGYENESDKVRAISVWIGNNIALDIEAALEEKNEEALPSEIILKRLAGPGHHAHLFLAMCQEAKLKCYKVRGYVKGRFYEEGDPFYISNHIWNTVRIDSSWYMVDMAWGSGTIERTKGLEVTNTDEKNDIKNNQLEWKQEFKELYFLAQPQDWIMTHLPADPMWQMRYHPMPLDSFEHSNQAILAFLASNPQDTTLRYDYAIEKYNKAHTFYKPVQAANNAMKYNPRNHKVVTYGNATYAFHLTEGRTRNVSICKKAKKHYTNALENGQVYKSDITAMYAYGKKKLLNRQSMILKPNKSYTGRNSKFIEGFSRESDKTDERINRLNERLSGWELKAKEATKDNLKSVERPKKQREGADSILQVNIKKIEANNVGVQEAMNVSKILQDSTQYYYQKISNNWKKEAELYSQIRGNIDILTRLNISYAKIKQLKPYSQKVDSLKQKCIKEIQQENKDILDTIDLLYVQKTSQDSASIALLKANKKLVRQNKRMTTEDIKEDEEYEVFNKNLKTVYKMKNQIYENKIQYQKDYIKKLEEDKRLKVIENKTLEEERTTEEKLFVERTTFIKSLYEARQAQLLELTTKCKDRMKIVDGIIRSAGGK
ncbi:MAG: transglutaminase domain-containing protein [Chitinophagales bacterium]